MILSKEYYIIENTDMINAKLIGIIEKKRTIQQINKREQIIKGLTFENMLKEDVYINEDIMLLNRKAKKIFDTISLRLEQYIPIILKNDDLKFEDKFWQFYVPFISEDDFSSENKNIKNGFHLSQLVGNCRIFRIKREGKILNIVDEDVKKKLLKLEKQNLKFTRISVNTG